LRRDCAHADDRLRTAFFLLQEVFDDLERGQLKIFGAVIKTVVDGAFMKDEEPVLLGGQDF